MENLTKINKENDETSKLVFNVVENVLRIESNLTYTKEGEHNNFNSAFYLKWSELDNDNLTTRGYFNPNKFIEVEYQHNPQIMYESHSLSFWSKYSGYFASNQIKFCSYCKKMKKPVSFYSSHYLYNNGKVICPILLNSACHFCGAKGHTISHCKQNAILIRDFARILEYVNIRKCSESFQQALGAIAIDKARGREFQTHTTQPQRFLQAQK